MKHDYVNLLNVVAAQGASPEVVWLQQKVRIALRWPEVCLKFLL